MSPKHAIVGELPNWKVNVAHAARRADEIVRERGGSLLGWGNKHKDRTPHFKALVEARAAAEARKIERIEAIRRRFEFLRSQEKSGGAA